jgi:hypothetical protein
MPRIAGTKEKFKSISIEQSLFEEIHKQQRIGEPIYMTVRRMLHQADQDEQADTRFLLAEMTEACQNWKNKCLNMANGIDQYYDK